MMDKKRACPPNHNLILNELNRESILVFLRNNPPSPPPNTRDEDGNAYAAHFRNLAEGIKLNLNPQDPIVVRRPSLDQTGKREMLATS